MDESVPIDVVEVRAISKENAEHVIRSSIEESLNENAEQKVGGGVTQEALDVDLGATQERDSEQVQDQIEEADLDESEENPEPDTAVDAEQEPLREGEHEREYFEGTHERGVD